MPIDLPHLTARIAALFRRVEALAAPPKSETVLSRGDLTLNLNRLAVSWRGSRVNQTLTELRMLHTLARFPGHVKNRDQLIQEAVLKPVYALLLDRPTELFDDDMAQASTLGGAAVEAAEVIVA